MLDARGHVLLTDFGLAGLAVDAPYARRQFRVGFLAFVVAADTEQRIAELMRVPLGSAKVVRAILEGVELKEYADRAGISINTVRFHLKSAFDLTGARSQVELVRTVLSALNDLGPYFPDAG